MSGISRNVPQVDTQMDFGRSHKKVPKTSETKDSIRCDSESHPLEPFKQ